ncbi:hypothetical protein AVEN_241594-1 [Araneus ventricosus]|uniref:Ig-like domain-containing protein n=1 Tax=Araneus ventricosus TaxID=182803 RepID=A0A4Y2H8C5_ARAVE|nr:hypothetical protein AVEN_241594-1 [Araneus ventricosus]
MAPWNPILELRKKIVLSAVTVDGHITVAPYRSFIDISCDAVSHHSCCDMRFRMITALIDYSSCITIEDPTAVYVEDRTSIQEDESGGAYKVDLKCVPSGWFVYDSIVWLKDGAAIYRQKGDIFSIASEQRLQLNLTAPFRMENVSEFQGYYYCSVDLDNSYGPIFSPKLLVKFPGLHTFILHVKSEIPEKSNCSDLNSLQLPFIEEFNKFLGVLYSDGSRLFLKEVTCSE